MEVNPESSAADTIPVSTPSPQVSSTTSATPARSRPGVVLIPASHPPFRAPVGGMVSVTSGAFTSPAVGPHSARCGDTAY
jgi:hypothetical protein